MSSINNSNSSLNQTNIGQSVNRTKQDTGFSLMVKNGLSTAINTVQSTAGAVLPFAVPGGAVLSAAISSAGNMANSGLASGSGGASSGGLTTAQPSVGGGLVGGAVGGTSVAMGNLNSLASKGDTGASMAVAQREMMEMNQSFNMQYLGLQQQMQNENRQFTTLSNLIKTRHDTAKAAINNIK